MTAVETYPKVVINASLCKGCGLCIIACPKNCLVASPDLNEKSFHPAAYTGEGCIGCGTCFYTCPEPGAIEVYPKDHKE
ncbi:4Fe-4S binding protein [candidate division WOR-3 bacterium]|nr:4Fe-4S binding protein [candidate division WOR-3 bacterium]